MAPDQAGCVQAYRHSAASSTPWRDSAENSADADVGGLAAEFAEHRLGLRQRGLRVAPVELVGLGQQHQQRTSPVTTRGAISSQQALVQVGEAEPRIDHQHHARQAAPVRQVVGHDLLPAQLGGALDRRIAVARQVGEQRVGRRRAGPSSNRLMCCVRPGVRDANASRRCCASVLIAVDLPALLRPTKAISGQLAGPAVGRAGWRWSGSVRRAARPARAWPRRWARQRPGRMGVMGHCKISRFDSADPPISAAR